MLDIENDARTALIGVVYKYFNIFNVRRD